MRGNGFPSAFLKKAAGALAIVLFLLTPACQTPPKKTRTTSSVNRSHTANQAGNHDTIDLFSASAERFGTDPRAARPLLVTDTVWIVVAGAAGVITLAALVSAIRGARAGRASSRRRA